MPVAGVNSLTYLSNVLNVFLFESLTSENCLLGIVFINQTFAKMIVFDENLEEANVL